MEVCVGEAAASLTGWGRRTPPRANSSAAGTQAAVQAGAEASQLRAQRDVIRVQPRLGWAPYDRGMERRGRCHGRCAESARRGRPHGLVAGCHYYSELFVVFCSGSATASWPLGATVGA
eukprot:364165-Chlamydomonas_euryale.AAC.6